MLFIVLCAFEQALVPGVMAHYPSALVLLYY